MLIFFLYSSLYVIAVVCLGKEMSPELCELLPWEQRRGKSCSSVSSLQVMNPYFYKILYECSRCVVNPVYKHNSSKSGRTSFPSYTAYSWVFSDQDLCVCELMYIGEELLRLPWD